MRSRNIKPGFFKNEELVKLPEAIRLLFIGLWCMADRRGRLEDRPTKIKMELYPADQHDVSTMLEQLQDHGFILRYEVKSNRYIQIINFEKHQYPNIKEKDSTIPAPYKHRTSTEQKRLNPGVLNPESPILNTDISQHHTRFVKPKPEEVTAYAKSIGFVLNGERFCDYYEARGWMYSKTRIQDWKAVVRLWKTNNEENKHGTDDSQSPISYAALARAKRANENLRKDSPAGEVHAGVRDLPDVPVKTEAG